MAVRVKRVTSNLFFYIKISILKFNIFVGNNRTVYHGMIIIFFLVEKYIKEPRWMISTEDDIASRML